LAKGRARGVPRRAAFRSAKAGMDLAAAAGIPDDQILGVLRRRSAIAIGLLLVCAVADFLAIAAEVGDYHLVSQLRSGAYVSLAAASTADNRVHDLGWVQIGLFVATAVAFIAWFRYAYGNLERLGVAGLRFGQGWAIGGWFVPVLGFVRPKQIANDIWRGSDPDLPGQVNLRSGGSVPCFLNWWWGAFVLAGVAGRIAFTTNRDATTPSAVSSSLKFLIASDVIDVFAALLAVVVVYETTARQRARIARRRGEETVAPASIRTWRIGAGACLAVGLIVLAFVVGVAVAPSSTTGSGSNQASGEAAKPAKQVVADAVQAAEGASSFHLSGKARLSSKPVRLDFSFVRGKIAAGSVRSGGLKFDVVVIGDTAYLRGNSAYWKQAGLPSREAQLLSDTWLKGSANNQAFKSFTHQYNARTFLNRLNHAGALASQGATTYKGRSVVAIHDPAGETLYVMASGTPYPVAVVSGGDTLTFDRWNQPVRPTAPKGALDIGHLRSG